MSHHDEVADLMAEVPQAEAEIERLKAALREIIEVRAPTWGVMQDIVRAALEGEAMTDIVEQARREGSGRGELDGDGTDALLLELAAEIERLRELLEAERLASKLRWEEIERLRALLTRCETILANMALENDLSISRRWPINHEPLRADAKNLLPEVRAVLEKK